MIVTYSKPLFRRNKSFKWKVLNGNTATLVSLKYERKEHLLKAMGVGLCTHHSCIKWSCGPAGGGRCEPLPESEFTVELSRVLQETHRNAKLKMPTCHPISSLKIQPFNKKNSVVSL